VTGKNFEAVLRTPQVGQVESGHKSIHHIFSKWQQQVSPEVYPQKYPQSLGSDVVDKFHATAEILQ
jgi:hypothetical protein